jgi:small subunit ribosomal protein S6
MVVMNPTVEETGVQDVAGRVNKYVTDHGGQMEGQDFLGKRRLAYPIGNRMEGTYVLSTFHIDPPHTPELESQLRINEDVLRFLLIRKDE